LKQLWPDYRPIVMMPRTKKLGPVRNSPGIFDDKLIISDATKRGDPQGIAMPLLLDLARKPLFLHDASVAGLDALLDPRRGAKQPHPFYVTDARARADLVAFLKALDTTTR
jgi:hypothetical protein